MNVLQINIQKEEQWEKLQKPWEFCVGSCHASRALGADWQEQLARCHRELGIKRVRFHGLFDDDMSVVLKPMFSQQLHLSFANIDKIFDFLVSIGMQPFVELGFMPEALASGRNTVFHYKGNTTPPAEYKQWQWLIESFLQHMIDRYGREEVRQWYFEVWNEPNLGGKDSPYGFWSADREEYFRLYQTTAESIKKIDSRLRVGGPATSNNAWLPEMIAFCEENGVPLDFLSTHQYPTDVVVGYGVEDSANFKNPLDLNDAEKIKSIMTDEKAREEFLEEYGVFQQHLWEHVDRGVWTEAAKRAVEEAGKYPLYYTEWGSLAGLESDGSFGASFAVKTMLDARNLAAGYSFWGFSDIFEEGGQAAPAFHGGFGLMTQQGIPKAPYRAFALLHGLGEEISTNIFRSGTVDGYVIRKKEAGAVQILLVNHHSLLHPIQEETVSIVVEGSAGCVEAVIERIDDTHANACSAWQEMGAPLYLNEKIYHMLTAASQLQRENVPFTQKEGALFLEVKVPAMGTALITLLLV